MAQTAIDWVISVVDKLIPSPDLENVKKLLERAKEIEKRQIMDAAKTVLFNSTGLGDKAAEEYYNETYKQIKTN